MCVSFCVNLSPFLSTHANINTFLSTCVQFTCIHFWTLLSTCARLCPLVSTCLFVSSCVHVWFGVTYLKPLEPSLLGRKWPEELRRYAPKKIQFYWHLTFDIQTMDQFTNSPMDQWTKGAMDQWTDGQINQWSLRYHQDIQISLRCAQGILKISPRYPQDVPKISQRYP